MRLNSFVDSLNMPTTPTPPISTRATAALTKRKTVRFGVRRQRDDVGSPTSPHASGPRGRTVELLPTHIPKIGKRIDFVSSDNPVELEKQ